MRMRKLFAGAAALATLLGGLALGATTASAATLTDGEITLSGKTVKGHTYSAYRIADYDTAKATVDDTAKPAKVTGIVLTTVDGWKSVAEGAVNAVAANTTTSAPYRQYNDPVAYAAATYQSKGAQLNTFAKHLATNVGSNRAAQEQPVSADGADVTFSDLTEGLYLVVDSNGFPLTIVGTKVTVNNKAYSWLNSVELGKAKVKPDTTPQSKKVTPGTVSVGQDVSYTLSATIPDPVVDSYTLKFIDKPGAGQNVNIGNIVVTATKGKDTQNLAKGTDKDYTVTPSEGANVSEDGNTFTADGNHTFTIALNNASSLAGWTITVEYSATVTNNAPLASGKQYHEVLNRLVDNNGTVIPGTETTVKYYDFNFTKVNKADEGIQGAKFAIKDNASSKYLAVDADGVWSGLTTKPAADATGTAAGVFESGSNGAVSVSGLKAGTYTVEEIAVADGYADYKPSFTVTLSENGNTFDDTAASDPWGLFNKDTQKVTNVKNITQLPLTGAAGITMFLVLAVALGGVAFVTYSKSRNTARALRA